MTARFNSFTVALETDIREDDAKALIDAISMMRGVLSVVGNETDSSFCIAEMRAKNDLKNKLYKIAQSL